jgi:hypothetical protein
VFAFHLYRQLDLSGTQGTIYVLLWVLVAAFMARVYYLIMHTQISERGVVGYTPWRRVQAEWSEISRAAVLKSGSLALYTTTDRIVIPLGLIADRHRVSDFVLAAVRQVGAPIERER